MMDFMVSSFRIMSPTSFVYGESVDASNFIQLDDLQCHFQPLNVTLQVLTLGESLSRGKGPGSFQETLCPGWLAGVECMGVYAFSANTHRISAFPGWHCAGQTPLLFSAQKEGCPLTSSQLSSRRSLAAEAHPASQPKEPHRTPLHSPSVFTGWAGQPKDLPSPLPPAFSTLTEPGAQSPQRDSRAG